MIIAVLRSKYDCPDRIERSELKQFCKENELSVMRTHKYITDNRIDDLRNIYLGNENLWLSEKEVEEMEVHEKQIKKLEMDIARLKEDLADLEFGRKQGYDLDEDIEYTKDEIVRKETTLDAIL